MTEGLQSGGYSLVASSLTLPILKEGSTHWDWEPTVSKNQFWIQESTHWTDNSLGAYKGSAHWTGGLQSRSLQSRGLQSGSLRSHTIGFAAMDPLTGLEAYNLGAYSLEAYSRLQFHTADVLDTGMHSPVL